MKRVNFGSGRKYLFIALLAFGAFVLMPSYSSLVRAYPAHNASMQTHAAHHFGGPQWQMLLNGYNNGDWHAFPGNSSCLTVPYNPIYPALVSQLCTGQPQQLFAFAPADQPGVFTIQVSNGGCLALSDLGTVVRRTCGAFGGHGQLWQHTPGWFGGQGFRLFQAGQFGLCLTGRVNNSVGLGPCFGPQANWYFPRSFWHDVSF